MRLTAILISAILLIAASFGCGGAGGDPTFSPDPGVGDIDGDGDSPGGGGGEVRMPGDDAAAGGEGAPDDCFEDGFCSMKCASAEDCPPGFSCIMHLCTFDCRTDEECGAGGTCSESGLCEVADSEPVPGCTQDSECGEGRFCNMAGGCEKIPVVLGCRDDADCPAGQYCEDDHGCEVYPGAGVECSADEDCPGNYHCGETYLCERECISHYECGEGEACNSYGYCEAVGGPARIARISFSTAGADLDPHVPAAFESASYRIDWVEVAPAGRGEMLTSPGFRLVGGGSTAPEVSGGASAIPYQGDITDALGQAVDGTVRIEARLYDSLIAGIGQGVDNSHVIFAEGHPAVWVEGGVFRINIGEGAPLDPEEPSLPIARLLETDNAYLELWIDGERLSPRQRLGSVPAVFHSNYARYADEVASLPPITEANLPNYPAELIGAGTVDRACIPGGLHVGTIEGTLTSDFIPDLSAEDFEQLGHIPPDMIGQMSADRIAGGTISSGMLPDGSYIARDDFMVVTGSVADEQMLVFPTGFEPSQCEHIITPGVTMGSVEGIDQIYLENNSGVIRCEVDWHEASDGTSHTVPCTANYMIICKR